MHDLFLDTNVILDFLADRQPHSEHAAVLFDMAEKNLIQIHVSAISFNNLYYILRKATTHKKAIGLISLLNDLVSVVEMDQAVLDQALASEFKDFEDAIQHSCAMKVKKIDAIITRNQKDFKLSQISILSPKAAAALLMS